MLFNKKVINCKTKQNEQIFTHTIEYHRALPKVENAHFQILKTMMADKDMIIDIDTTLFPPYTRLNPTEYAESLQKKLINHGIKYKISRGKKEVLEAGLGKIFGMKGSKVDVAYRISIYIPLSTFSYDCYKDLLEGSGYRVCILNNDSDIENLLELFYSGMIDDLDFSELFYAYFYCNEQLTQIQVTTQHLNEMQMNKQLETII